MADSKLLSFYHNDSEGIVLRAFDSGKWGKPTPVAPGALGNFTVSTDRHGALYLFCQDAEGDVHLHRLRQGDWKSRMMLKNPGGKQARLHIYPMIRDDGMSIIYNSAGTDGGTLMLQSMGERGKWNPPTSIDSYSPMGDDFYVQTLAPDHALLFYARKSADPVIGYVEASPERATTFNTIYSTSHRIIDTSFLVTNDSLHALFIVKGMFSSQLMYRKKPGQSFSAPVVLAEAAQITNCLLMFVCGKLHAYFISAGQLVYAYSTDGGETFSGVMRYTNKFCAVPIKSVYISQMPMDKRDFFVRQLYVDRNNVSDVQLLPDMYDDFYPAAIMAATRVADTQAVSMPQPTDTTHGEISLYRDKLDIANKQLAEKDRQLMRQLQASSDEKAQLLSTIHKLESELHQMKSVKAETTEKPSQPEDIRKYPLMIVQPPSLLFNTD